MPSVNVDVTWAQRPDMVFCFSSAMAPEIFPLTELRFANIRDTSELSPALLLILFDIASMPVPISCAIPLSPPAAASKVAAAPG